MYHGLKNTPSPHSSCPPPPPSLLPSFPPSLPPFPPSDPSSCGAGYGMAMWVVENYIVLLDATDLGHVKGCTLDPPYLDRYGEPDPGLRYIRTCTCTCTYMYVCVYVGDCTGRLRSFNSIAIYDSFHATPNDTDSRNPSVRGMAKLYYEA